MAELFAYAVDTLPNDILGNIYEFAGILPPDIRGFITVSENKVSLQSWKSAEFAILDKFISSLKYYIEGFRAYICRGKHEPPIMRNITNGTYERRLHVYYYMFKRLEHTFVYQAFMIYESIRKKTQVPIVTRFMNAIGKINVVAPNNKWTKNSKNYIQLYDIAKLDPAALICIGQYLGSGKSLEVINRDVPQTPTVQISFLDLPEFPHTPIYTFPVTDGMKKYNIAPYTPDDIYNRAHEFIQEIIPHEDPIPSIDEFRKQIMANRTLIN